jgi:hypothetical protein
MPGPRFTCTLTKDEEAACTEYARVTVADRTGHRERGCTRHAIATIDNTIGATVDWTDTKGLNEMERKALDLTVQNAQAHRYPRTQAEADELVPARTGPEAEIEAEPWPTGRTQRWRLPGKGRKGISPYPGHKGVHEVRIRQEDLRCPGKIGTPRFFPDRAQTARLLTGPCRQAGGADGVSQNQALAWANVPLEATRSVRPKTTRTRDTQAYATDEHVGVHHDGTRHVAGGEARRARGSGGKLHTWKGEGLMEEMDAAARAVGAEVAGRCSLLFGDQALIELPGEEEPVRHPAAEIAAATGLDAGELPGRRLMVTVRETPEEGRVLSGFRLA